MADSVTVTDEAVEALNKMAAQLEELTKHIHTQTQLLKSIYEDNKEGLGKHSDSILKLIEDVESTEEEAGKPVKKLVLKLQRSALIRQKLIIENLYSGKGRSR